MEAARIVETINHTHTVEDLLGQVAEAVEDRALKARILELREQWHLLVNDVSRCMIGREVQHVEGSPRKRRSRRKSEPDLSGKSIEGSGAGEESCGPELA